MKTFYSRMILSLVCFVCIVSLKSFGQSTGFIIRPAAGDGSKVLDPLATPPAGYTSKLISGFAGDDVNNAKLPFKPIRSYSLEPFGDIRRGADHLFTDFVPDASGNGTYVYFDGTNFLFRFRMGTLIPGAKGYSVLIDSDNKFGNTGASPDPSFEATTTGTNGNPGFEIEIVLETNSRLAIYNVNNGSNPTVHKIYSAWQDYSQVSIAGTFDNGDPDFFLDFYVPFSDLSGSAFPFNLTTSTPLRMVATTVMAPKPAIGGPKSDIYGVSDKDYPVANDQYAAIIGAQSPFTLDGISVAGNTPVGTLCTAAPVISSATSATSTNGVVKGTWTKNLSGASSTATILIYKNGNYTTPFATVNNMTSGSSWEASGLVINSGDVFTARAQVSGEISTCYTSNEATATNCNALTRPATLLSFAASEKGMEGTGWTSNHYISIWRITSAGNFWVAAGVPTGTGKVGFTTTTGTGGWFYSGGVTGGGGSFPLGTYMAFDSIANGCSSIPIYACATAVTGNGGTSAATAAPVVTSSTPLYPSTTSISGTCVSNSRVRIYIDGILVNNNAATSATTWSHTFTPALTTGQKVKVTAQIADATASNKTTYYCEGATTELSVICLTNTIPVITADANKKVSAGLPISGVSSEPVNSIINIYSSPSNTLVGSATVTSTGTWTTSFNATDGVNYYAKVKSPTCNESILQSDIVTAAAATSSARCGSITTATITAATTIVEGTLATGFTGTTISLYIDGNLVGSTSTDNTSWTISGITPNTLYSSGVLTMGIKQGTALEVICSNTKIVSCSAPAAPIITPENTTIGPNGTQKYRITNPTKGIFYGIADASTGRSLATGVWAPSNTPFDITTNPVTTTGNITVVVKATSLTSTEMCTINSAPRTLSVSTSSLPLDLVSFNGKKVNQSVVLKWSTANEVNTSHFEVERSSNGASFVKVGEVAVSGNRQDNYSFTDNNPLAGNNYYRLRMVDKDQKFTYSKVIVINMATATTIIAVWPNPFLDEINIDSYFKEAGKVNIKLLNESGSLLETKDVISQKGNNTIHFVPSKKLSPGIYFLQIQTNEGISQQKLIRLSN